MRAIAFDALPVLTGERVTLRPITDADTDDIVRWRNADEVRRNFIFRETFTPEMHRRWFEAKVRSGEVIQYIIEAGEPRRSVGSVYLRDIDEKNDSAEYGIFIGEEDARGQGFGSETARLFSDFALDTLDLHRLSLRLLAGNDRAKRSYEKAGFVTEGIFVDMVKLDGAYRSVIFMAKLKEQGR